jgi:hypothetical protein
MDKRAFLDGYMAKAAADTTGLVDMLKGSDFLTLTSVPVGAGFLGGVLHSKMNSPSARQIDEEQIDYLNKHIERALDDMDRSEKSKRIKDNAGPTGKTLRF